MLNGGELIGFGAADADPLPRICDAVDLYDEDGPAYNSGFFRDAAFTGIANSKSGTVSLWFRLDHETGTSQRILWNSDTGCQTVFHVKRGGFGGAPKSIDIEAKNSSGTVILRLHTVSTFGVSASWVHVLASWNLATGVGHLYINDVSDLDGAYTLLTDDTILYDGLNHDWWVNDPSCGYYFHGCLAEIYINPGVYIDLSATANRRKFITALGKPANLGATGSAPTGTAPISYQHIDDGEAAANFATNRGTGGDWVADASPAPTTASTSPSD